jgi:hypothetical protein
MSFAVRLLIAWGLLSAAFCGPLLLALPVRMALRRLGWLAKPAIKQIEDPTSVVRETVLP